MQGVHNYEQQVYNKQQISTKRVSQTNDKWHNTVHALGKANWK